MTPDDVQELLLRGEIEVVGRITASSNQALLVEVTLDGVTLEACYKTELGERPLWDFPDGLWRREVAAFQLSAALGMDLIPETVAREDGPFGVGSLQRWIPNTTDDHYFTLRDNEPLHPWFRALAAFDVVANNTDRKSGHVLFDGSRCWAIDHGLTFNIEEKLRTVVWEFAGDPLTADVVTHLERLLDLNLEKVFGPLLHDEEVAATRERAERLLAWGHFPEPDEEGEWPPYPWPLI